MKRTGDVEARVYHAGALAVGEGLKSYTTVGVLMDESTITNPYVGYLVDAHSAATAIEDLTIRSCLARL